MRPTVLVPLFIYLLICTVPLGLGLKLIVSPEATGNFLHDTFNIFPAIETSEVTKRRFYRGLGLVLLAAWAGAVYSVYTHIIFPLLMSFST